VNDPAPIDIPFRVFLKVFVAAFAVFALLKITPILMLLMLAVLIATTLFPIQEWLVKHRVPRTLAFLLLAVLLIGTFVAFLFVLLPKVVDQFGALPEHFAKVAKEISEKIDNESIRAKIEAAVKDPQKMLGDLPGKVVAVSTVVMNGVFNIGLMLVMALYLLAEGKKTYRWLRAFFSAPNQKKLDETSDQVAAIVAAYVAGQMITSGLVAIFVYLTLTILKVPAALSVGVLSAVFDILPMIGFLVSLGIALVLAITVS
jgi:predicted PurR-regulated permease PerM